uniref:Dendritic cell-specific transmembrane protein-like domain-containing protein n=1 Tax=Anopheles farauti TaxID=69004 RepID=A0A182QHZ8_9DIPT
MKLLFYTIASVLLLLQLAVASCEGKDSPYLPVHTVPVDRPEASAKTWPGQKQPGSVLFAYLPFHTGPSSPDARPVVTYRAVVVSLLAMRFSLLPVLLLQSFGPSENEENVFAASDVGLPSVPKSIAMSQGNGQPDCNRISWAVDAILPSGILSRTVGRDMTGGTIALSDLLGLPVSQRQLPFIPTGGVKTYQTGGQHVTLWLVLVNLDLPDAVRFYFGLTVALALGRNLLKTITITLVLLGPIENMTRNGKEVIRVLTCSAELAFNLTLTRVDLMSKPFQNALAQGRDRLPELKREFSQIVSIVEPIVREVEYAESEEDGVSAEKESSPAIRTAEDYQQMYVAKLNERCLAQLETGVKRCKAAFERTYDECSESLPPLVNTLLCWPMKIDFACSSAELFGVGTVCRMEDVLDADFGVNYRLLKQTEQQLTGGVGGITIDYQVPDLRNHSGYLTIKTASKQMGKEFSKKKHFLRLAMYLVRKVFAFIFLRVIYGSVRYHNAYLWRINFNNFYITDHFRQMDESRRVTGTGALAELIRSTVEGFRTHEHLDFRTSNEECLPRPVRLSGWVVTGIYGLFALLTILIATEAYVQRARRMICAFFYPGRERMRTVFLYNRVLRQTQTLQKMIVGRIVQLTNNPSARVLPFRERLALHHPVLFGWLRSGRCTTCGGDEMAPRECQRYDCFLRYCDGCWQDIGQQCVVCVEQDVRRSDRSHCCNPPAAVGFVHNLKR